MAKARARVPGVILHVVERGWLTSTEEAADNREGRTAAKAAAAAAAAAAERALGDRGEAEPAD